MTLQEAISKYGVIQNGKWADESKWMILCPIPPSISAVWINSASHTQTVHIYINKDVSQPLLTALQNIESRGLLSQLHTFDGCFMIRDVRAMPGHPSCHSYGLAVDLNASQNTLGATPTLTPEFVKCFTDEGWSWGGNFKRQDGMHFSKAWE